MKIKFPSVKIVPTEDGAKFGMVIYRLPDSIHGRKLVKLKDLEVGDFYIKVAYIKNDKAYAPRKDTIFYVKNVGPAELPKEKRHTIYMLTWYVTELADYVPGLSSAKDRLILSQVEYYE